MSPANTAFSFWGIQLTKWNSSFQNLQNRFFFLLQFPWVGSIYHNTCTHTRTAPSEMMDWLSLSSVSESMSEPYDSGWADLWTLSLSTSHHRWYTDKPSQWMDLSGKWLCVRFHSLFLQRLMECNVLTDQSRCSKLSRLHRWSVKYYSGLQLLCNHLF